MIRQRQGTGLPNVIVERRNNRTDLIRHRSGRQRIHANHRTNGVIAVCTGTAIAGIGVAGHGHVQCHRCCRHRKRGGRDGNHEAQQDGEAAMCTLHDSKLYRDARAANINFLL
jgi:hypothetical protein